MFLFNASNARKERRATKESSARRHANVEQPGLLYGWGSSGLGLNFFIGWSALWDMEPAPADRETSRPAHGFFHAVEAA